jgi:hypothetical protein
MSISKDNSILQRFMRGGIDLGFRTFVHLSRVFLPTNDSLRVRSGSRMADPCLVILVPRLGGAGAVNQESLDAGAAGSSKLSLTALYVSYINGI